jgi:putative transposase
VSRRPRLTLPGVTLHVLQRGNRGGPCFFDEDDYQTYLDWLETYAMESGCAVHAYALMATRIHLLLTPPTSTAAAKMMKHLGQRYVQHVNVARERKGTLWEGRFRSCMVAGPDYVLACQRYIELSPVRSGAVDHPAEYHWSSYRANASGEKSTLLTPHPAYAALGADEDARLASYRELFHEPLDPELIEQIRSAVNGNYVLASPEFQNEVARRLLQPVTPGKPGRPRRRRDGEPASPAA